MILRWRYERLRGKHLGFRATGGQGMYANLLFIVLSIPCSYTESQRSNVVLTLSLGRKACMNWPGILDVSGNFDRMGDQLDFAIQLGVRIFLPCSVFASKPTSNV